MLICCGHCQPRLFGTDQNMSEPQEICFLSVGPSRSCASANPGWRPLHLAQVVGLVFTAEVLCTQTTT